MILGK